MQTGAKVLGNKDGVKQKKAIDANSDIATLYNECIYMTVEDGVLSPS